MTDFSLCFFLQYLFSLLLVLLEIYHCHRSHTYHHHIWHSARGNCTSVPIMVSLRFSCLGFSFEPSALTFLGVESCDSLPLDWGLRLQTPESHYDRLSRSDFSTCSSLLSGTATGLLSDPVSFHKAKYYLFKAKAFQRKHNKKLIHKPSLPGGRPPSTWRT